MNQREQKNKKRKFIEEDGNKEDKINESEEKKALIEIANDQEFREENLLDNVDESGAKKNLINRLDYDCLAKILSYVPLLDRLEMEKVCEKWEEAVDLSWYTIKKLELDDLMITLDKKEEMLKMLIIKCGRYLTHLTITGDHYPWMSSLLKDNCKNIINFTIDMKIIDDKWKISEEDVVEIIGSMQKLKYFKVEMNLYKSLDLPDEIVDKLPNDIHEIHLISQVKHWSKKTTPVLNKFKSLHCLTLDGCELTNETLEGILENNNTLTKLNLSYCTFPSDALSIFKNLNKLEEIILYGVREFDINEVASIAHNCLKLKHFELINNSRVMTLVPFNIYRELKYLNLENLSIYGVDKSDNEDEHVLFGMINNWKQLKHLDIDGGRNFSTGDLEEIIKLTNLQYLNLHSRRIDSETSIIIANNCLELKELIMDTSNLSEAAFFELANLKKLEKMDFYDNDNLNDYLLERIVNNCKNLVELYLCECKNVTEASLIQIGKLKHLKKLRLYKIKNVPNAMFDNFKKLEYLSCYNCPNVTDEGIKKVLDNCQKLSTLNLCRTGITVESLVHASKRKFFFKLLKIEVDLHVKNEYKKINCTPSPYLIICS